MSLQTVAKIILFSFPAKCKVFIFNIFLREKSFSANKIVL